MAEDFLRKMNIKELDREQVIWLLGKPDFDHGQQIGYVLSIITADFMAIFFMLDGREQVIKA